MRGKWASLILAIIGTSGYDICHNIAGGKISPILGAAVVGLTEIFLTTICLLVYAAYGATPGSFSCTRAGIIACIGIGAFGWCIDVGLLSVYRLKQFFQLSNIAPLVLIASILLTFAWGIELNKDTLDRDKVIGIILGVGCLYFISPK